MRILLISFAILFTPLTVCASSGTLLEDIARRKLDGLDRRFTCTMPGYTQCPQAGLPNNFCCPADTVCLSLGASFTILCCPTDNDCSEQSPISCDIEQQNATAHPESLIKTTDLSSDMLTCGLGCCPFGFNCTPNGNCSMFAEQKSIIDAELATPSTSSIPIGQSEVPTRKFLHCRDNAQECWVSMIF
jgi:hypothetical protein